MTREVAILLFLLVLFFRELHVPGHNNSVKSAGEQIALLVIAPSARCNHPTMALRLRYIVIAS